MQAGSVDVARKIEVDGEDAGGFPVGAVGDGEVGFVGTGGRVGAVGVDDFGGGLVKDWVGGSGPIGARDGHAVDAGVKGVEEGGGVD